jgi:hypothetical protein
MQPDSGTVRSGARREGAPTAKDPRSSGVLRFHAFMSYSHAADGRFAPALQAALQRFAKPWYRRRALHIFRDKTNLSATPGLWPTIERALADSQHFILLASPEAGRSQWVQREVDWWLARRSARTLLIVVTDGVLIWDTPPPTRVQATAEL